MRVVHSDPFISVRVLVGKERTDCRGHPNGTCVARLGECKGMDHYWLSSAGGNTRGDLRAEDLEVNDVKSSV